MKDADLIIIGGGASGMTAAICAARRGLRVMILEHGARLGKKILSTGNGRCNLSNLSVSAQDYGGGNEKWIDEALSGYDTDAVCLFFESIGVPAAAEDGRIYPRTMQGNTVLDALRFEIVRLGIRTETSAEVVSAEKRGDAFYLSMKDGASFSSDLLLMAPGGLAAPKTGSDGSANRLIRSFGHTITPQLPALVPLVTNAKYRKALCGQRIDGRIDLYADGKFVQSETGQIQFTDYGLSGIPVFQLSGDAAAALHEGRSVQVCLDLLPSLSAAEVGDELLNRIHLFAYDDMQTILNGFLPKKLVNVLCRICGIRPSDTLAALFPDMDPQTWPVAPMPGQLVEMTYLCKAFYQTVTGTRDFDMAQTTAGGVPAEELTPSMASRMVPGLFFAGEIVDVNGRCGGYNLHWAWISGMAAADAAADSIGR